MIKFCQLDVPKMWQNERLQQKMTISAVEWLQTHWVW
jgi:hypothetical protein